MARPRSGARVADPEEAAALPDLLNRHDLKRLMRAPDEMVWAREHHGRRERDRLILALFAYAGLRGSELLGPLFAGYHNVRQPIENSALFTGLQGV